MGILMLMALSNQPPMPVHASRRLRSCLGWLGRALAVVLLLVLVVAGTALVYIVRHPPFGRQRVVRVLVVGLDEATHGTHGLLRRSDTIILCAVRLDGSGATLLSVPRDARVRLPGRRGYGKINTAFALGQTALLKETLGQPKVLDARLPYHLVIDSRTVATMVDALGGVVLTVPHDMDYDDNWGNLHIHLKAGTQRLNGAQVVGFLRWRKNNTGRIHGDDIQRGERQRAVIAALGQQARTRDGLRRLPDVYRAFRAHSWTNLSLPQLLHLGFAARRLHSSAVPGEPRLFGGISYQVCDWVAGRKIWREAIE